MNRRKVLLGIGTAAAGAGAVFGSGAFTQVEAQRDLTIGIDDDSDALIGIEASADVTSVYEASSGDNAGELVIDTDELGGEGFAVGSTVDIGDIESGDVVDGGEAFTVTNNFDDVGDGTGDIDIALDLTSIDIVEVDGLSSLKFYGTPSTDNGTQVTSAGERKVFDVSSGDHIDFAIRFETASTTGPEGLSDATVTFQAGSDLTSEDFPSEASKTIEDWSDLDAVRNNLAANYKLVNDLDSSTAGYGDVVESGESGFDPLGEFSGTLDGNGHTISDLDISGSDDYVGLFKSVTGTVQDLTIASANVTNDNEKFGTGILAGQLKGTVQDVVISLSDSNDTNAILDGGVGVGGIAGYLNGGTIQNISVSGEKEIKGNYNLQDDGTIFGSIGGLVGYVNNGGTINGSKTSITVKGAKGVGGIIGNAAYGSISITGSEATGNVEGTKLEDDAGGVWPNGQTIGGLVGAGVAGDLTIRESYTTGTVTGTEAVGGLVGEGPPDVIIKRSYSTVDITANESPESGAKMDEIGGLIGSGGNIDISNSYTAASITVNNAETPEPDHVGGVFGGYEDFDDVETFSATASDTYWDTERSGASNGVGDDNGTSNLTTTGLTTSEMQGDTADNNMDFDFGDEWETNSGDYPTLQ